MVNNGVRSFICILVGLGTVSSMSPETYSTLDGSKTPDFMPFIKSKLQDDAVAEEFRQIVEQNYHIKLHETDFVQMIEELETKSLFDLFSQTPIEGVTSQVKNDDEMNKKQIELANEFYEGKNFDDFGGLQKKLKPYILTHLAAQAEEDKDDVEFSGKSLSSEIVRLMNADKKTLPPVKAANNEKLSKWKRESDWISELIKEVENAKEFKHLVFEQLTFTILKIFARASFNPGYIDSDNLELMSSRIEKLIREDVKILVEKRSLPESAEHKPIKEAAESHFQKLSHDLTAAIADEKGLKKTGALLRQFLDKFESVLKEAIANHRLII